MPRGRGLTRCTALRWSFAFDASRSSNDTSHPLVVSCRVVGGISHVRGGRWTDRRASPRSEPPTAAFAFIRIDIHAWLPPPTRGRPRPGDDAGWEKSR